MAMASWLPRPAVATIIEITTAVTPPVVLHQVTMITWQWTP